MIIEYAKLTERTFFTRKVENLTEIYKHQLFESYENFKTDLLAVYKEDFKQFIIKKQAFDKKICVCGYPLRYISDYNFWGCSRYKDQNKKHSTIHGVEPNFYAPKITIPLSWINTIINNAGLKGTVKVKQVYELLISNGYEDLKEVYNGKSSENNFNGFINGNKRSKEQEKICLDYLSEKFKRVKYQQQIAYKLVNGRESFCIPDFICSDEKKILVVDAKLFLLDDNKMDLYVSLVRYIANQCNDKRPVSGAFMVYNKSEYTGKHRYEIIEVCFKSSTNNG